MIQDLTRHDALTARSVAVIDSFDDIDDMASIGVVLDALVDTVHQIRDAEAVLAVRDHVEADRLAYVLDQGPTIAWKVEWLREQTDCNTATAEQLISMTGRQYQSLAPDGSLHRVPAALKVAADGFADELDDLLVPHDAVPTVPDTVPEGWS